jgi:hypothetical protein
LVTRCTMLHTIQIKCYASYRIGKDAARITRTSYELIAEKLYKTIRDVKITFPNFVKVSLVELREIFQDCWQDVYVNACRMQKLICRNPMRY